MFKSKSRFIISMVASVLIVIFSFNFVPRDVAILTSWTPTRQAFDYIFNFVIFFVSVYLLLSLLALIKRKVFPVQNNKKDVMKKMIPKAKNKFVVSIVSILAVLLVIAGYNIYQLYVARLTKLDVPTFSYPHHSIFYRYSIRLNGLTAIFGGQSMSISQVTAEVEKDMKKIKSSGFDGAKLGYSFQANNYLADQAAIKASDQGLYPIGMLQGPGSQTDGRAFTPDEMAQWQNYVRGEVSTNKNIIYFWEIWGEPSLNKYGSPEEFVQLLKVTYPIIKKANPNAKVIVTLSADGRDTGFENQVLALGGGNYFDVLSFHPYGANQYLQEELVKGAIAYEQSTVAKYNNRWPLVISEIGQPASEVSEEEQARLAKFLYTEADKNKIPVTWFYWSDEHLLKNEKTGDGANWGLIRFDGTQRPMFNVIKEFLQ